MPKPISVLGISLFLCLIVSSYTQDRAPDQIIEVFRHGARAPLHEYDPSWKSSELGNLTAVGMRQQYILGKLLASRYPMIFGTPYDPEQVYMLSDITPRCIQSAYAQLQGIYEGKGLELKTGYPASLAVPPNQDGRVVEILNNIAGVEALPNRNIVPIVDIIDKDKTYIFKNNGPECPNGKKWEAENMLDQAAKEGLKIFNSTIEKINKKVGDAFKIKTFKDFKAFCATMVVNFADNRTLPYGIGDDKDLVRNITYAYEYTAYQIWGGQKQQVQLYSFGMIDSILEQIEAFRAGKSQRKAVLYSAHDSNLFSMLSAFGFLNTSCILDNFYASLKGEELPFQNCSYPHFAANLIVEFYNARANEPAFVKLLYNSQVLKLCKGRDRCLYEEFVALARNVTGNLTLDAYPETCGVPVSSASQPVSSGSLGKNLTILVLTVLCLALIADRINTRRKMGQGKQAYVKMEESQEGIQLPYTNL